MIDAIKLVLPGSFPFLIIGSLMCLVSLYGPPRVRALGRGALALLLALYCVMSVPAAVDAFAWPLRGAYETPSAPGPDAPKLIVVLTGRCETTRVDGIRVDVTNPVTRLRVLETAVLFAHTHATVIVSGASPTGTPETETVRGELVRHGVPADRIQLESGSRTTHESALYVTRVLHGRPALLVTSAMHMRRAMRSFTKAGAHVIPVSAPDSFGEAEGGFASRLTPSLLAFQVGESAVYEYFGLAYYWSRGWV